MKTPYNPYEDQLSTPPQQSKEGKCKECDYYEEDGKTRCPFCKRKFSSSPKEEGEKCEENVIKVIPPPPAPDLSNIKFEYHQNPSPTPPPEKWEESFDKQFEGYWRGNAIPDEIKFFISRILSQAREEARSETLKEVREEAFFEGYKAGYDVQIPFEYLEDEQKESVLKRLQALSEDNKK